MTLILTKRLHLQSEVQVFLLPSRFICMIVSALPAKPPISGDWRGSGGAGCASEPCPRCWFFQASTQPECWDRAQPPTTPPRSSLAQGRPLCVRHEACATTAAAWRLTALGLAAQPCSQVQRGVLPTTPALLGL